MIAWRRKIVCWSCLWWLEILLKFVGVGDVSFCYKSFSSRNWVFLRYCLRLTSVSKFFSSLMDSEFTFLMMKVGFRITSGNFRVSLKLNLMQFSFAGNWIKIHMVFHFFKAQSFLFQDSSDPDVTPNITFIRNMKFQ